MDAWLRDVPPITRSWVILCALTTIAVVRTPFSPGSPSLHHSDYTQNLLANRNGYPATAVFQF